jgi:SNF2 family DNA or RNA helicase
MQKGVPEQEIAFIHDANTDVQKAKLFTKVRSGQVRFLLGSTSKMGAGTNVQDKLIALHHLDVPWRPADIEQQEGRILRQGNQNEKVKIFRYITENTFDAYSWVRHEVA